MTTGKTASIEDALLARLGALVTTPVCSFAWPSVEFTPAVGVPYLEPQVMPNRTDEAGLGVGVAERHFGLFQVTVYAPGNEGAAAGSELADQVIAHFPRGTVIAGSGVRVRIGAFNGGSGVPYRSRGFSEKGWYVVAVTIPYWCDIF